MQHKWISRSSNGDDEEDGAAGAFGGSFGSLGQVLKHEDGEENGPNGMHEEVQQPQQHGQEPAATTTSEPNHLGLGQPLHRNGFTASSDHAAAAGVADGGAPHVNGKIQVRSQPYLHTSTPTACEG